MPSNFLTTDVDLGAPSPYFLQRMFDFDNMLVFFASRKTPGAYVVARRRQRTAGLGDQTFLRGVTHPDTIICLTNGLVPVCLMYKTGPSWDPDPIIRSLMARDMWAMGGAEKVADMLEEQEAKDKAKLQAEIRDDQWNRSGDAWRSYQHRTGQSTIASKDFHKLKPRTGAADGSNRPT